MLYDMDYGAELVSSKSAEEYDIIQIGISRLDPRTWDKMIRTVDTALANLKPSESSKLTWTCCAALIGYNSSEPTNSTNHLWKFAYEAFRGHRKSANKFVGGLVRWRISLLKGDTWLCMREVRNEIDIDTGKPIKASTYWINNNWKPKIKNNFSIADLTKKFNTRGSYA